MKLDILTDDNAVEEGDVIYAKQRILPSGIYRSKISQAYLVVSKSGAKGICVRYEVQKKGENKPYDISETLWITNKDGKNYFTYKDGSGTGVLKGYTLANDLCKLFVGKSLQEVNFEDRTIEMFNYEAKKNIPTTVPMIVDLVGCEVALGILEVHENKRKLVNGEYVSINEKRISNIIDKVFKFTNGGAITATEFNAKKEPTHFKEWLEAYKDKPRDLFKEVEEEKSSSNDGSPIQGLDLI